MEHTKRCTKHGHAAVLFIAVLLCNCNFLEAKMLPWFTYADNVDDLLQYVKNKAPIGQRSVFLLAKELGIINNIDLTSGYYAKELPFELTIVCETLKVQNSYTIDLSGANAPDYVSPSAMNPPHTHSKYYFGPNWQDTIANDGKAGADGGSIYIYAKHKRGDGTLTINVSGGNGGRGQDGHRGHPGRAQTKYIPVEHGEDGGDGGDGGSGGDAGEMVVISMDNPSNIIGQVTSDGGLGGEGGSGGKGGRGEASSNWWYLTAARRGDNGINGTPGKPGRKTLVYKNTLQSNRDFYRSIPITGNHLQRALNAEMYKILLTRHQNSNDKWTKIMNSIKWIRNIASASDYDVVYQRCAYMLGLCDQFQNKPSLSSRIRINNGDIKKHLEKLKRVAEQAVIIAPYNINSRIKESQLLESHSHYTRAFNHMARQFNKSKERHDNVKKHAQQFGIPFNLGSTITDFISSRFSSKLSSTITSLARSKSYINKALDAVEIIEVTVDTAEILGELAVSAEVAPVLGLVIAEQVVEFNIERAALNIIAGSIISELNTIWNKYFDDMEKGLTSSEKKIHARAKENKRTRSNLNSRISKDKILTETHIPIKRKPYLRDRKRSPKQNTDPPEPYELTGKYIGVLDKLEPVETNSNQVVATFDAIYIAFTVPKEETMVTLNHLDEVQEEELFATLEIYRAPISTLPSFFITLTMNSQLINENKVGKWFEFDCKFGSGSESADAAIISPIIAFNDNLIPSFMASLDTDDDIPVTVMTNSIIQIIPSMEKEIILALGLDVSIAAQQKSARRHVTESSHITSGVYCGDSRERYVVRRVEVANVGQGSCNLLYTQSHNNYRPAAVYDLGYGKGKLTGMAENNLINMIAQAYSIIISHWDLDHYRYLLRNPQRILETRKYITAPVFGSNTGVSVRRAVRSIRDDDRRLIDTNTVYIQFILPGAVVSNIDMRTTTAGGRTKNDVGAITVSILDNNCNPLMLMPGDASYNYVSNQQKLSSIQNSPSLKYLIATHHGSTRNIGQIPQALNNHFFSAVMYSYGLNNRYGHSSENAQPWYQQQGWNANPQVTVGTTHGLYVILDLDRSNLTPPHRF